MQLNFFTFVLSFFSRQFIWRVNGAHVLYIVNVCVQIKVDPNSELNWRLFFENKKEQS